MRRKYHVSPGEHNNNNNVYDAPSNDADDNNDDNATSSSISAKEVTTDMLRLQNWMKKIGSSMILLFQGMVICDTSPRENNNLSSTNKMVMTAPTWIIILHGECWLMGRHRQARS